MTITQSQTGLTIVEDDYLTASVPNLPLWNETMAGMFVDRKSGISGIFYIGRWWAQPTTLRAMMALLWPDNRVCFMRNYAPARDGTSPTAGGLTMTPLGGGKLHYGYSGPVDQRHQSDVARRGLGVGPTNLLDADFTFTPQLDAWNMHSHESEVLEDKDKNLFFNGGHMEQLGTMSGTIRVGGEEFKIDDAYGIRDHSRGPRNFAPHQSHIWVNARFASGWGFCGIRASVAGMDGYAVNSFCVFRDGKQYSATLESPDLLLVPGQDIWAPIDFVLVAEGYEPIPVHVSQMWGLWSFSMHNPADLSFDMPVGLSPEDALWSMEQNGIFEARGEVGIGRVERSHRALKMDDQWQAMCAPKNLVGPFPLTT